VPSDARTTIAALATLAAAAALSITVALDDVLPGELRTIREAQTWGILGGWFADTIRFLTTTQVVVATGIAVAIALWLLDERRGAIALAIALVLLEIAQPLIKEIVDRPRPSEDLVDIRGSITSASFPAGHVMSPTVLYGLLATLAIARLNYAAYLSTQARNDEAAREILHRVADDAMPGVTGAALYERALELAGDLEGFMGAGDERVSFVGHGFGLEIDELPLLAKGWEEPLEAGMVFALEPKFVFPGVGAVGIENSYLVTGDGAERLTSAPEDLLEL